MDLETENRLAAMLVEEARRLQAQADKEGVLAYLHRPNVRGRPNSRFLTATVLGVEQANRAVEVNELWRAREKEKELNGKLKRRMKDRELNDDDDNHISNSNRSTYNSRHEQHYRNSNNPSSNKHGHDHEEKDGLRDDELEEFLHSRAKRGRGDIGPRMDEPGPYLSSPSKFDDCETREKEDWEHRIIGPQKFPFFKSHDSLYENIHASDSKKKQVTKEKKKKKKSKEERSDRKKRRAEKKKKSKHRCHKKRGSRSDSE